MQRDGHSLCLSSLFSLFFRGPSVTSLLTQPQRISGQVLFLYFPIATSLQQLTEDTAPDSDGIAVGVTEVADRRYSTVSLRAEAAGFGQELYSAAFTVSLLK